MRDCICADVCVFFMWQHVFIDGSFMVVLIGSNGPNTGGFGDQNQRLMIRLFKWGGGKGND